MLWIEASGVMLNSVVQCPAVIAPYLSETQWKMPDGRGQPALLIDGELFVR